MELPDWQRPKPTSVAWLFVFALTVPVVRTLMEVFLYGRQFRLIVEWSRASTIVGILAGVLVFLGQYMAREKHAWRALESKLRGDAFRVEGLWQEIAALQARIKSNQEEIDALRARLEVTVGDQTAGTKQKSEW